jgi:AcrR family transcriptional regulator
MPYEVTKHIKGHDYRYQVVSFRDPQSRKVRQSWTYVGRLEGGAVPVAPKPRSDTRERIVSAILQLLDTRDVSHVTIDVIIRTAAVSRGTFYRYFPDKASALTFAVETAFSQIRLAPRTLEGPVGSIEFERRRLALWVEEMLRHAVRSPGIQRAIQSSPQLRKARHEQGELSHATIHDMLVRYINRLHNAGLVDCEAPDSLAWGVAAVINGVFKRVVNDGASTLEPALLAGGIELISRALFATT